MKKRSILAIIAVFSLFLMSIANAQTVSHSAGQITAGTFGTGDFTLNLYKAAHIYSH